jgi:hypothetical protein
VAPMTLNSCTEQSGVARFALVEMDADGHDLVVLQGALSSVSTGSRWPRSSTTIAETLPAPFSATRSNSWWRGHRTGELTSRGLEFYSSWNASWTFAETNYLASEAGAATELPAVIL